MLLRDHYDMVYAVCRRVTGHDADAADAAQNAMIAIVKGLPRFDARSRFSTWAYRIAINAAIDETRRRARRPVLDLDDRRQEVSRDVEDSLAGGVDVDAALLKLPVEYRAPVVLRDMCGLDYEEIADVLGIPPGTVRSRISRGRAALVNLLGPVRSDP
jgi:RNA polymerase sigma-70 factor (ECF subfamily)